MYTLLIQQGVKEPSLVRYMGDGLAKEMWNNMWEVSRIEFIKHLRRISQEIAEDHTSKQITMEVGNCVSPLVCDAVNRGLAKVNKMYRVNGMSVKDAKDFADILYSLQEVHPPVTMNKNPNLGDLLRAKLNQTDNSAF